jgi:ADP-heptose:LPS heptosyltransferase
LTIVLTGSRAERELTSQIAGMMQSSAVNLAGSTTLGAAAALASQAALVITNDTGMSHLAAAVGTPSVVIVLGSDAPRWAPLDRARHQTVSAAVPCRPCEYRICPIDFPCAALVDAKHVLTAANRVLAESKSGASLACWPERAATPIRARETAPLSTD